MMKPQTRRSFLRTSAIAGTALGLSQLNGLAVSSHSGKKVKVALIGCGGRGKNDLRNFLKGCRLLGLEGEVVALADVFQSQIDLLAEGLELPQTRHFTGFDAYQKVAETDAEFVLDVSPPLFRAMHLETFLNAGKHVFIEKPVAVDPVGCRKIIELGGLAESKRLAVVAGTQRRHDFIYRKNKALVDAGAIGKVTGGVVGWNGTVPWIKERRAGDSDVDYLTRNWLNWAEVSGDHICEQNVHCLDVANWFVGRTPRSAVGVGGRARRESGNCYDFFSIDYDYGDNVHIHNMCRQMEGCHNRRIEELRGSKGAVFAGGKLSGDKSVQVQDPACDTQNGQVQEMIDMIRGAREGEPLNEARTVAESTATAVMGRIAAYTGEMVRWTDLLINEKSKWYNFTMGIAAEDFLSGNVTMPAEGIVPVPGSGDSILRRS